MNPLTYESAEVLLCLCTSQINKLTILQDDINRRKLQLLRNQLALILLFLNPMKLEKGQERGKEMEEWRNPDKNISLVDLTLDSYLKQIL